MERGEGGRVRRDRSKLPLQIASAVCLASFTTQTTPVGPASCLRQKVPSSPALGVRGGVQPALGRMHLTGKGRGPPTPLRSQLPSLPRAPARLQRDGLGRQAAGRRACRSRRFPIPQGLGDWKSMSARGASTGRGMGFTSTHRGPGGSVTVGEALAGCKWQEAQLSPAELKTTVCSVT